MNKYIGLKRRGVVVHDAHGLKDFWEEIIETQSKQKEIEDSRLTRSALNKLRHEWAQRLEGRIKMLQKTSEKPKGQTALLPIETFQSIHKTAA
ncbi:protein FAM240B-like [Hemicordylus capensis]|uniref:protein FAM240B-like n=1 Tax=Hemicordylus capensis TaxID=884348 RepID=UPI002302F1CD|nr:protein FAM240B-like [Hemicordylus capensis]